MNFLFHQIFPFFIFSLNSYIFYYLIGLSKGFVKSQTIYPILDPLAFVQHISQIKHKKRGQSYVVSTKKSSLSTDIPLPKKRNIEKPSSSEVAARLEFSTSHPPPDPTFDEVFVEEDEDRDEENLIPRRSRLNLAEDPAPSGSKSPVGARSNEAIQLVDGEPNIDEDRNPTPTSSRSLPSINISTRLHESTNPPQKYESSRSKLVNSFPAPSENPNQTRSVLVTVPADTNFLSRPVGIANYLLPLISLSDKEKMDNVSDYCLFNEGMHATARVSLKTLLICFQRLS